MVPEYYRLIEAYQRQDANVTSTLLVALIVLLGFGLMDKIKVSLPWLPYVYTGLVLALYVFATFVISQGV